MYLFYRSKRTVAPIPGRGGQQNGQRLRSARLVAWAAHPSHTGPPWQPAPPVSGSTFSPQQRCPFGSSAGREQVPQTFPTDQLRSRRTPINTVVAPHQLSGGSSTPCPESVSRPRNRGLVPSNPCECTYFTVRDAPRLYFRETLYNEKYINSASAEDPSSRIANDAAVPISLLAGPVPCRRLLKRIMLHGCTHSPSTIVGKIRGQQPPHPLRVEMYPVNPVDFVLRLSILLFERSIEDETDQMGSVPPIHPVPFTC